MLPAEVGEELRQNIDAAVQGYMERMNLATREQLEIQEKILRRSRQRVSDLEVRVSELESILGSAPGKPTNEWRFSTALVLRQRTESFR